MARCKYCKGEMEKLYAFPTKEGVEYFRCPDCGASTAARPIVYDEEGMLPDRSKKKKKKESRTEESAASDKKE